MVAILSAILLDNFIIVIQVCLLWHYCI